KQPEAKVLIAPTIKMKLIRIPAGKFLMGSNAENIAADPVLKTAPFADREDRRCEGPQHEVEITEPFFMGVHEVTVGQFRAFVQETGYTTIAEADQGAQAPNPMFQWVGDPMVNWRNPSFPQTDSHPVVCVTWFDAVEFCKWLSKKEGRTY